MLTRATTGRPQRRASCALLDLVGEGRAERRGPRRRRASGSAPGHALELRSIVDAANATGQPEAQAVGF